MNRSRLPGRFGIVVPVFDAVRGVPSAIPIQLSFPFIEPVGQLSVVNMETVSHRVLVRFLRSQPPQFLFDLRPFPSFDVGQLSRRKVFDLFNEVQITYRDLAGALQLAATQEIALAAAELARTMWETVEASSAPTRRLGLLVDGSKGSMWAKMHLTGLLGRASWRVHEVEG